MAKQRRQVSLDQLQGSKCLFRNFSTAFENASCLLGCVMPNPSCSEETSMDWGTAFVIARVDVHVPFQSQWAQSKDQNMELGI